MTNKERLELREAGARCMNDMKARFEEALEESDLEEVKYWLREYNGGAKVLEALRLISCEEHIALTDEMFDIWTEANRRRACEEEAV